MSEITKSGINECINQEKGKNKREATSPLLENIETQCTRLSSSIGLTPSHTLDSTTGITGSKTDTTRSKRTKTHSDCSDCSDDSISQTTPVNAPYNTRQIIDWNSIMAYSQIPPYNPMHSPFLPSPPPPGYAGVPPPWAADLIKDIKVIKDKMKSIEKNCKFDKCKSRRHRNKSKSHIYTSHRHRAILRIPRKRKRVCKSWSKRGPQGVQAV